MYKMEKWIKDYKHMFWIGTAVALGIGIFLLIKLTTGIGFQWEKIDMGYLGYQKIIFIGDSRVLAMEENNTYDDVEFVGDYGKGLKWFRKEGYSQLMDLLKNNNSPQPIALVFNLGINDYRYNSDKYVPYFRKIAQKLRDQNCYLFYMSVNPVEEEKLKQQEEYVMRTNEEIQKFNQKLKEGLGEDYVWLDMSSELERKGFATREGLHYCDSTVGYILSRSLKMVMDAGVYPQEYCWRRKAGNWYAFQWKDNSVVKSAWIRDGEGEFYLDKKGRLQMDKELTDQNGTVYTVGRTGRRKLSEENSFSNNLQQEAMNSETGIFSKEESYIWKNG